MLLLTIVIGVGYLVGFRFENGLVSAIGVSLLVLAVGFTFSWISACIGLSLKQVEAVQAALFTWIFPVVFVSSAFVPVAGMACFLQPIAGRTPSRSGATWPGTSSNGDSASSTSTTGLPVDTFEALVVKSVLWIAGLLIVFMPARDPALPQARLSQSRNIAGNGGRLRRPDA